MIDTAVVVAGGEPIPEDALDELPDSVWVVAADSGLDHARRIGLRVDLVVGDMDSVTEEGLARHEGPVERHAPDKDRTDLELALAAAGGRPNVERIVVLGGQGGRIDHLLANAAAVTAPELAHADIEWIAGRARIHVVRSHVSLHGVPGEVVTLLAVGGTATGVRTSGLRWELQDASLEPWSAHGVSNELVRPVASVRVGAGVLLAIQPDGLPAGHDEA